MIVKSCGLCIINCWRTKHLALYLSVLSCRPSGETRCSVVWSALSWDDFYEGRSSGGSIETKGIIIF